MTLPTRRQQARLGRLLHEALLEMRQHGWGGRSEQATALADACHNLPLMMFSPRFDWAYARAEFEAYQARFPRRGMDYLQVLYAIEREEESKG